MHAIQLMEIGKCFSLCSATEVTLRNRPPVKACHDYWLASRHRIEHWTTRIQEHRLAVAEMGVSARVRKWQEIAPLLQEILLSEPVARSVAHHALLLESRGVDSELIFLAKTVLDAHLESRHRCLHLLIFGSGIPAEIVRRLNHIRLTCESYNDLLRSLMPSVAANAQAFDALSFQPQVSAELHRSVSASSSPATLIKVQAKCLSDWFLRTCSLELDYQAISGKYNSRIAAALLRMLPESSFDSFGIHQSPDYARLVGPSSEGAHLPFSAADSSEGTSFQLAYDNEDSLNDKHGSPSDEVPPTKMISSPLDLLNETNQNLRPEARSLSRRWG